MLSRCGGSDMLSRAFAESAAVMVGDESLKGSSSRCDIAVPSRSAGYPYARNASLDLVV